MSGFDPQAFMLLAEDLAKCPTEHPIYDAHLRSAISRAYYSAYLAANAKQRLPTSSHHKLFSYYKQQGDGTLVSIGTRLECLYRDRVNADYGYLISNLKWVTASALDEASQLKTLIDGWPDKI